MSVLLQPYKVAGPSWRLDNYNAQYVLFNNKAATGKSDILICQGWEGSVHIFGVFVGTITLSTSPDGQNFVQVLSTTVPVLFGRNDMKFPAYALQLNVSAFTSGQIGAAFYGERRHR